MKLRSLLLLGLVLATAAGTASAQWKWRDGNGQVHISDMPPPRDVPAAQILQRPDSSDRRTLLPVATQPEGGNAAKPEGDNAAKPGADKSKVDPELEAKRKKADNEETAKRKAIEEKNAAIRAENCQRARSHMASLDSGMRIARVNDKGEREFLDDNARADEVARTRRIIESECK